MRAEARAQMQANRMGKQAYKEGIKAMLSQETLDAAAVHSMIDERIDEMASFAHEMADTFIALHATLDDDQRTQLIETMEEAAERHSARRSRHSDERDERGER